MSNEKDLEKALKYSELRKSENFEQAEKLNLKGSDLSDENLLDVNLSNANIEGADFKNANLKNTNLIGVDIEGAKNLKI